MWAMFSIVDPRAPTCGQRCVGSTSSARIATSARSAAHWASLGAGGGSTLPPMSWVTISSAGMSRKSLVPDIASHKSTPALNTSAR